MNSLEQSLISFDLATEQLRETTTKVLWQLVALTQADGTYSKYRDGTQAVMASLKANRANEAARHLIQLLKQANVVEKEGKWVVNTPVSE